MAKEVAIDKILGGSCGVSRVFDGDPSACLLVYAQRKKINLKDLFEQATTLFLSSDLVQRQRNRSYTHTLHVNEHRLDLINHIFLFKLILCTSCVVALFVSCASFQVPYALFTLNEMFTRGDKVMLCCQVRSFLLFTPV